MIRATIFQDSEKAARGVELEGHAGYGEMGQDIVCAAVSALALNMANSVEAFTKDGFQADVGEQEGRFSFHFTGKVSPASRLLADSLILGLQNIQDAYGAQYMTIQFKEV